MNSEYIERVKVWALYAAIVLAFSIVSALVNRWIGPTPLPAPPAPEPQIVVVAPEGSPPMRVTVVRPEKSP
jgi:hypothetical protein